MQWNPFDKSQYAPTEAKTLPRAQVNPNLVQQASPQQQLTLPPPLPPTPLALPSVPQQQQNPFASFGKWAITPVIPESAVSFIPGPTGSVARFITRMTSPAEIGFTVGTLGWGASLGASIRGTTALGKLAASSVPKIAQKPISWAGRATANLVEPVYMGTPSQIATLSKAAATRGTTFGSVKTSRGNIVPRTGKELALVGGAQLGFEQAAEPMAEALGPVGGAIGTTLAGLTGGVVAAMGGASAARAFKKGLQRTTAEAPKPEPRTEQEIKLEQKEFIESELPITWKASLYDTYSPKIKDTGDKLTTPIKVDEDGNLEDAVLRKSIQEDGELIINELQLESKKPVVEADRDAYEKNIPKFMQRSPKIFHDLWNKIQKHGAPSAAARNPLEQLHVMIKQLDGSLPRLTKEMSAYVRADDSWHRKVYGDIDENDFIKVNDGGWLTDDAIKRMAEAGIEDPHLWTHHRLEEAITGFSRSGKDIKADFGALDKLGLVTDDMKDLANRWSLNLLKIEGVGKTFGYPLTLKEEFLENNFDELYLKYGVKPGVDDLRGLLPEGVSFKKFENEFVRGYVPRQMAEYNPVNGERINVGYAFVDNTGAGTYHPVGQGSKFEIHRTFNSAKEATDADLKFVSLAETKQMFLSNRLKRILLHNMAKFITRESVEDDNFLKTFTGRKSLYPWVFSDTKYGKQSKALWKKQITDKRFAEQAPRTMIRQEGGAPWNAAEFIDVDKEVADMVARSKRKDYKPDAYEEVKGKMTKTKARKIVDQMVDDRVAEIAEQHLNPFILTNLKELEKFTDGFFALGKFFESQSTGSRISLSKKFKKAQINQIRDMINKFPELENLRNIFTPNESDEIMNLANLFFEDMSTSAGYWRNLKKFKDAPKNKNQFMEVKKIMDEEYGYSSPRPFAFQIRINQLQRLFDENLNRIPELKKQEIINSITNFRAMSVEDRNLMDESYLRKFLKTSDIAIAEYHRLLDNTAKVELDKVIRRISKILPKAKKGVRAFAPEGGPVGARWITSESPLFTLLEKGVEGPAAWYDPTNRQILLNEKRINELWEDFNDKEIFSPNTLQLPKSMIRDYQDFVDTILYHEINHINNMQNIKNGLIDPKFADETPLQTEARVTELAIKELEDIGLRSKTKKTIKDSTWGEERLHKDSLSDVLENSNKIYLHSNPDLVSKVREIMTKFHEDEFANKLNEEIASGTKRVTKYRSWKISKPWGNQPGTVHRQATGIDDIKFKDLQYQNLPSTDNVLYISGGRNYARGGADIHFMNDPETQEFKTRFRKSWEDDSSRVTMDGESLNIEHGVRSKDRTSREMKIMRDAFEDYIKKFGKPKLIVVGGATGADAHARKLARQFGIETRVMEMDGRARGDDTLEAWENINYWNTGGKGGVIHGVSVSTGKNTAPVKDSMGKPVYWSDEVIEKYASKLEDLKYDDTPDIRIEKIGKMRARIIEWGQGTAKQNFKKHQTVEGMRTWNVVYAPSAGPKRNQIAINKYRPSHALTFDEIDPKTGLGGRGTRSAKDHLIGRNIEYFEYGIEGKYQETVSAIWPSQGILRTGRLVGRDISKDKLFIDENDWDKTGIANILGDDIKKILEGGGLVTRKGKWVKEYATTEEKIEALAAKGISAKAYPLTKEVVAAPTYEISSKNKDGFGHQFSALAAQFSEGEIGGRPLKGKTIEEVWQLDIKDPENVLQKGYAKLRTGDDWQRIDFNIKNLRNTHKSVKPMEIHQAYIAQDKIYPWGVPKVLGGGITRNIKITGEKLKRLYPEYYELMKRKPADNDVINVPFNYERLNHQYDQLWDKWAEQNPGAIRWLSEKTTNKVIIDSHNKQDLLKTDLRLVNSQAKSLARILTDRFGTVRQHRRGEKYIGNIDEKLVDRDKNVFWIFGDNVAAANQASYFDKKVKRYIYSSRGGLAKHMRGSEYNPEQDAKNRGISVEEVIRNPKLGWIPKREKPNTFGIRTKWYPDMKKGSFFKDKNGAMDPEIKQMIDEDIARIPKNSPINISYNPTAKEYNIGVGLSQLKEDAPETFKYLQQQIRSKLEIGGMTPADIAAEPNKIFLIGDNYRKSNWYPFSRKVKYTKKLARNIQDKHAVIPKWAVAGLDADGDPVVSVRPIEATEVPTRRTKLEPISVDKFGNIKYKQIKVKFDANRKIYNFEEGTYKPDRDIVVKADPANPTVPQRTKGGAYIPASPHGYYIPDELYKQGGLKEVYEIDTGRFRTEVDKFGNKIEIPIKRKVKPKALDLTEEIEYVQEGDVAYQLANDVRDYKNVIALPIKKGAGTRAGFDGNFYMDTPNGKVDPAAKMAIDKAFEDLETLKLKMRDPITREVPEIVIDEDTLLDQIDLLGTIEKRTITDPRLEGKQWDLRKSRAPRAAATMDYIRSKIEALDPKENYTQQAAEKAARDIPSEIPNLRTLPPLEEGMSNEDYIKSLELWFQTIPHNKDIVIPGAQKFNTPWSEDVSRIPITERLEQMFRFGGDLDDKRWKLGGPPPKGRAGRLKFDQYDELNKLLAERKKIETAMDNINNKQNPNLIEETDYTFNKVNAAPARSLIPDDDELLSKVIGLNKDSYNNYLKSDFVLTKEIIEATKKGYDKLDTKRASFQEAKDGSEVMDDSGIFKAHVLEDGEFTFTKIPFFKNTVFKRKNIWDAEQKREIDKFVNDFRKLQEVIDVNKIVAAMQKANEVQRLIALGGDGSIFSIQLIQLWFYKPMIAVGATRTWARTLVEAWSKPDAIDALAKRRLEDPQIKWIRRVMPRVFRSVSTPNETTEALQSGGILMKILERIKLRKPAMAFKLALESALDYAGDELAIALYPQIKRTKGLFLTNKSTGMKIEVPENIVNNALRTNNLYSEYAGNENNTSLMSVLLDGKFQEWAKQIKIFGEDSSLAVYKINNAKPEELMNLISIGKNYKGFNWGTIKEVFPNMRDAFEVKLDPYSLKEVSEFINYMRGISSSAEMGVPARQRLWEAIFLLAPRYRRAVAGMYGKLFSKDKFTRQQAQKSIVRFYGGLAATVISIQMMKSVIDGDSPEKMSGTIQDLLDPTSGSFMLFDVEGQKIGPGSKILSDMKIAAKAANYFWKEATGQELEDWEDFTSIDRDNPTLKWVRAQLAAAPSEGVDFMLGSDFIGEPAYRGKNLFEKIENSARPIAQNAIPLWIWSSMMENSGTLDWESQVKGRVSRGAGEFFGLRAFPQGASTILRESSWDYYNTSYDKIEPFQKSLLQKLTNDHLEHIQKEQLERGTSDFAIYYANLKRIDQEFHDSLYAYMQIYPDSSEGNRDLLFRYGKLKDFRRGQRKETGVEIEFEEHDVNNTDPIKRALAQYYSLFDDPEVKVPNTNTVDWSKWDEKYDDLMETLTYAQQLAIMRNTDRLPLPRDFLERISRIGTGKEYTRLMQAEQLREDYLNSLGRPDLSKIQNEYFFMLED